MSNYNLLALSLAEIIGDFGWKDVARVGTPLGWASGTLGYVGVVYFLVQSLKVANVTYVNGMWDGISALVETAAAYFLFGERLNSWVQYFGLILIIVGIVALKGGGISK